MNTSIKEQLEVLFGCRNAAVHNKDVAFSRCFMTAAELHDLNLDELRKLLSRGMRPGKALRRLLEAAMKANAQQWAEREGLVDNKRTQFIEEFLDSSYQQLDEVVQGLTEVFLCCGICTRRALRFHPGRNRIRISERTQKLYGRRIR